MDMRRLGSIVIFGGLILVAGCVGAGDVSSPKDEAAEDFSDLAALDAKSDAFSYRMRILPPLAAGEERRVLYTSNPRFRALPFMASEGDRVGVSVRASVGDPVTWILDERFNVVAKNDDAHPGTRDSSIEATLPRSRGPLGLYYVVFRDYELERHWFTVELTLSGASSACLFGGSIDELFADARFGSISYQLVLADLEFTPEFKRQVVAAASPWMPGASSLSEVLARAEGNKAEVHQVERGATGTRYTVVTLRVADAGLVGAVYRSRSGEQAASIEGGRFVGCRDLWAEGGAQVGESCGAESACGATLRCVGVHEGVGRCVPAVEPVGAGSPCAAFETCGVDELFCADVDTGDDPGVCVPVWNRSGYENHEVVTLTPGETFIREVVIQGVPGAALDVDIFLEVVGALPSTLRVYLAGSDGTEATLWDGPAMLLAEPEIDSDDFLELSERAKGLSTTAAANGTYRLRIENEGGGELTVSSLSVTGG